MLAADAEPAAVTLVQGLLEAEVRSGHHDAQHVGQLFLERGIKLSGIRQSHHALIEPEELIQPLIRPVGPEQLANAAGRFLGRSLHEGPAAAGLPLQFAVAVAPLREGLGQAIDFTLRLELDADQRRAGAARREATAKVGPGGIVIEVEQAAAQGFHQAGLARAIGTVQDDDALWQIFQLEAGNAAPVLHVDAAENHSPPSRAN